MRLFPGVLEDEYARSPLHGRPHGFNNRGEFWIFVKK